MKQGYRRLVDHERDRGSRVSNRDKNKKLISLHRILLISLTKVKGNTGY